MKYDVIIVGGGIVGCATALAILRKDPALKLLLLEKESKLAVHQTGHNSGVIHAGVYYTPGSLKAKFCRQGCDDTKAFCQEHGIPFQVPGKLIVAVNEKELQWMEELIVRCEKNRLTVTRLTPEQIRAQQPGIQALGGFLVAETGIVNWAKVCQKYAELVREMGGEIRLGQTVTGIKETAQSVTVTTQSDRFEAGYLVTCAGLYSDKMVMLSGHKPEVRILPFRGEYYQLVEKYNGYFNHLIYPVPDPDRPFLGVHFTPQVSGIATVGPNAILALSREAYRWRDFNLREAAEIVTYWPLWKMLSQQLGAIVSELKGSISKQRYTKLLQQYFPGIQAGDLKPYPAGVRAQAIDAKGNLVNDFVFTESDRIVHTCNAPSPAATSSLPIGRYIAEKLFDKMRA
ncbi:MAG: L-2-hydroxyglutarate oxidase [Gammaproteobacteria bacterium CG11_big_fil_rev_8_21_14_0_20_46_22]|nr:MAG: L-2-hydroxyglutarate oxidase [Gammaproteobacteria bacterium CG12_big_fil_rev_8_21_14_0_65_46_12]PIR10319.1 MAG: L-2-hydroxyglutarate oxidase [Gammaproteobacteria bacterium CG11_big_fil_rev_8_21_14_0_20_46_22]